MLIACFFKKEHVNKKQGATPCGSQGSGLKQEKLVFDLRCDILVQEKQKLVLEVRKVSFEV